MTPAGPVLCTEPAQLSHHSHQ